MLLKSAHRIIIKQGRDKKPVEIRGRTNDKVVSETKHGAGAVLVAPGSSGLPEGQGRYEWTTDSFLEENKH